MPETSIYQNLKALTAFDNGRDVFVVRRNMAGKRSTLTFRNYPWYFAVDGKHYDRVKNLEQDPRIKIVKEGDYAKIFMPRDYDSEELREKVRELLDAARIKPLEMDLQLYKRFCIDNGVQIDPVLKILFVDIETDDSRNTIEIGRDRIISWASCDQNGETKFFYNKNEEEVLRSFIDEIKEYDVLCGWNSQEFDFPYIKERMKIYDLRMDWKKVICFDLMKRCIKMFAPGMNAMGLKGFSLDEVSHTFLDKGKVEIHEKINVLEKTDLKKLEEYNKNDVILLYELDKKLGLFDLMIKECEWTGTFLNKFYVGELLDNYILREAHKQGKFLPSQRKYSTERIQVEGAFVMEPVPGLYEKVRVFDFKSMYPSIIYSFNISHDTLLEEKADDCTETPNGYFYKREKGIYKDLIDQLLVARKQYKKNQVDAAYGTIEYNNARAMQEVVKELSNSMYGITADPNSRFFDKRIAESITLGGQHLLSKSKEFIEDIGYKVIYQDTDSLFVLIEDGDKIEPVLAETNLRLKTYLMEKFNLTDYIIEIEYEKTFDPLILVEKKHYSGFMTELSGKPVNKIYTKGLEVVKKDTIEYTRKKMTEILDLILIEKKGLPFFVTWMNDMKKEVFNREFTAEELKITKKISRPIADYRTKLPHVRLAEKLVKEGKILETQSSKHVWGQKIEFIVTNYGRNYEGNNHPHGQMNEILASEFQGVWDKTYYWNVQIFNVFNRLLKTVFPEYNWEQYLDKKKVRKEKYNSENQLKLF